LQFISLLEDTPSVRLLVQMDATPADEERRSRVQSKGVQFRLFAEVEAIVRCSFARLSSLSCLCLAGPRKAADESLRRAQLAVHAGCGGVSCPNPGVCDLTSPHFCRIHFGQHGLPKGVMVLNDAFNRNLQSAIYMHASLLTMTVLLSIKASVPRLVILRDLF